MTDHNMHDPAPPSNAMPTPPATAPCARFAELLGPFLEGELDQAERAEVTQHAANCGTCGALLGDIDGLVLTAKSLPPLSPSRDLWRGIEERLESPVVALASRASGAVQQQYSPRRSISVRQFAAAAALLVAASSAVTWRLVRPDVVRGVAPIELAERFSGPVVPSVNALTATDTTMAANALPASFDGAGSPDVDEVYVEQIASLRTLVEARFADLDSITVVELRRNLAIIDQAIADSRRALQRTPKSRVLSSQLDRALHTKLALMRRVALL